MLNMGVEREIRDRLVYMRVTTLGREGELPAEQNLCDLYIGGKLLAIEFGLLGSQVGGGGGLGHGEGVVGGAALTPTFHFSPDSSPPTQHPERAR